MDLTRREKIGLAVFLFIILFITSFYYYKDKRKNEMMVIKTSREQEENIKETDFKEIKVYICGEVKKPGVYTLIEGDRLYNLIDIAGGFTDKAAKENLNLAMKLKDEDYILVPSIESASNNQIKNSNSKININTASIEELKTLPRIGDAIAQRIIEYREKNGPFRDIKDIKNVSGIGDKMFENIKEKISVR